METIAAPALWVTRGLPAPGAVTLAFPQHSGGGQVPPLTHLHASLAAQYWAVMAMSFSTIRMERSEASGPAEGGEVSEKGENSQNSWAWRVRAVGAGRDFWDP